jgi:hypothetical protein
MPGDPGAAETPPWPPILEGEFYDVNVRRFFGQGQSL